MGEASPLPKGLTPPGRSADKPKVRISNSAATRNNQLSEADQKKVQALKERDQEVRAHERAHATTGGHLAGAPNYRFERGPDGQTYAVEGDVAIQMPNSKDPAVRAEEARQVKAAATAPAKPSSQDLKVAASAARIEQEAMAELRANGSGEMAHASTDKIRTCESCGALHGLERIISELGPSSGR